MASMVMTEKVKAQTEAAETAKPRAEVPEIVKPRTDVVETAKSSPTAEVTINSETRRMATVVKSMATSGVDGFMVEIEASTLRGQ